MSANGSAVPADSTEIQDKGKGKSVEESSHTVSFEEDDEEEESGADEVSLCHCGKQSDQIDMIILTCKSGS